MAKVNLTTLKLEEVSFVSDKISVSAFFPQPAIGETVQTNINLKQASKIKHEIYNMLGQRIVESTWQHYKVGAHAYPINTKLASGSYFVKISTDYGYFKSLKLIVN